MDITLSSDWHKSSSCGQIVLLFSLEAFLVFMVQFLCCCMMALKSGYLWFVTIVVFWTNGKNLQPLSFDKFNNRFVLPGTCTVTPCSFGHMQNDKLMFFINSVHINMKHHFLFSSSVHISTCLVECVTSVLEHWYEWKVYILLSWFRVSTYPLLFCCFYLFVHHVLFYLLSLCIFLSVLTGD